MTYGHLRADCLYTGISCGPNARYRVWEAFTFTFIKLTTTAVRRAGSAVSEHVRRVAALDGAGGEKQGRSDRVDR